MATTKARSRPPESRARDRSRPPQRKQPERPARPELGPPRGIPTAAVAPTERPPSVAAPVDDASRPYTRPPEPADILLSDGAGTVPTLTLPARAAAADDWQRDKRVAGLWSINETRNAWVNVQGIGWTRLADSSDATCMALAILAAHARQTQGQVNYRLGSDGKIVEMYVW